MATLSSSLTGCYRENSAPTSISPRPPTDLERGLRQPEPMLMETSNHDGRYSLSLWGRSRDPRDAALQRAPRSRLVHQCRHPALSRARLRRLPAGSPPFAGRLAIVIPFSFSHDTGKITNHRDTLRVWLDTTYLSRVRIPALFDTFRSTVGGGIPKGNIGARASDGTPLRLSPSADEVAAYPSQALAPSPPPDRGAIFRHRFPTLRNHPTSRF